MAPSCTRRDQYLASVVNPRGGVRDAGAEVGDGGGGVEAVFDALVVGVAEEERGADFEGAVDDEGGGGNRADGAEQRAVAVLEEVVIGGVELEAAEVGDED